MNDNSFELPAGAKSTAGSVLLNKSQANSPTKRRILGIDPGLASTGWGVIDVTARGMAYVSHGCIETNKDEIHAVRLLAIYNRILSVVHEFSPTEACMESLYFAKNVTSALSVAEARGVVSLCFAQNNIPLSEYSPLSIKQCVVGSARAEKKHVQSYVKLLLGLAAEPRPDHAADALAAAITHIHSVPTIRN